LKIWKWHTLVLSCPCCGTHSEYAAQIVEGKDKGSYWDPAYWCEKCSTALRARDTWIFGALFGPLMLVTGTISMEALQAWAIPQVAAIAFAAVCCAVIGWPLSRALSRHLLYWEPRDPGALQRAKLRRLRGDEE
jgi:hypothetical protein